MCMLASMDSCDLRVEILDFEPVDWHLILTSHFDDVSQGSQNLSRSIQTGMQVLFKMLVRRSLVYLEKVSKLSFYVTYLQ